MSKKSGADICSIKQGIFSAPHHTHKSHTPYHKKHSNNTLYHNTQQDSKTRQDKTRQDKTRQDKTRQDKTRQDKTRQDKTRHDTTRHDTTRHDTTRHDTTRHDTTREDKRRQEKTREDKRRQEKRREEMTADSWLPLESHGYQLHILVLIFSPLWHSEHCSGITLCQNHLRPSLKKKKKNTQRREIFRPQMLFFYSLFSYL